MEFSAYEQIPDSAQVAIYGTGAAGLGLKARLARLRPDVEVACFLDSRLEGTLDGLPVYSASNIDQALARAGLILVASAWWREIVGTLSRLRIPDSAYLVLCPAPLAVTPEQPLEEEGAA